MSSPNSNKNKRLQSYFFLLINVLCWGAGLIIVKPALEFTTPFRFLFYRYLIASLLSSPILFYFFKKRGFKPKKLLTITALELIGTTFALSLLYLGLAQTTAIEASLLATSTPIFITLAGIFLLNEKQEKYEWLGLILSFVGAILLVFNPILTNQRQLGLSFSLIGNLLIIGQNIIIALYYILVKKYYQDLPKLFATSLSFWIGLISFFLLSLVQLDFSFSSLITTIYQDWQQPSVQLASIYMASFGSIIGLTAYIKGQDHIEASEASLFTYLQPLVYLPLGFFLLHEPISVWQIFSLILILIGVIIAENRVKNKQ